MIAFSPGVAQGCFELIGIALRSRLTRDAVIEAFPQLCAMPTNDLFSFAQEMSWMHAGDDSVVVATAAGVRVTSHATYEWKLRQALLDFVEVRRPSWVQSAISGRSRVLSFAGAGISQLFVEAGLTGEADDDVVAFWDALAAGARGSRDAALTEIGRRGERLSLAYEARRTGRAPKWVAINNNADGYDVLSVVANDDLRSLTIEVKTTTQGLRGSIFLTRNEWEMARERADHCFHIWNVELEHPALATVAVDEIQEHVPTDSGKGRWSGVEVPIAVFATKFRVPDVKEAT